MNKDADLNNAKSEAKSNATRAVAAYLQVLMFPLNCFIFAFRVVARNFNLITFTL